MKSIMEQGTNFQLLDCKSFASIHEPAFLDKGERLKQDVTAVGFGFVHSHLLGICHGLLRSLTALLRSGVRCLSWHQNLCVCACACLTMQLQLKLLFDQVLAENHDSSAQLATGMKMSIRKILSQRHQWPMEPRASRAWISTEPSAVHFTCGANASVIFWQICIHSKYLLYMLYKVFTCLYNVYMTKKADLGNLGTLTSTHCPSNLDSIFFVRSES